MNKNTSFRKSRKQVFSGIQPSGVLHLGNYLGAIKQWVDLQNDFDCIYSIVDLHAITIPQDPEVLSNNIYRAAATYLACGVNPKQSAIYIQSHRPEHAELAWLIGSIAKMGEMKRMTQFKDKRGKFNEEEIPLGIFNYPVLMAADILLYQTDLVPVGEDQKQHVEITRDLAERFNRKFGPTFTLPEPKIHQTSARIMGLDDPTKKMSKSAESQYNYIALTDSKEDIRRKIMRAVTDSGSSITAGPDKPAMTNLLKIFSIISQSPIDQLEKRFDGKSYADFKTELAELVANTIGPISEKILELEQDKTELDKILANGAEKVAATACNTLKIAKQNLGLI